MFTICGINYYTEKEMTRHYPRSKSWFEKARREDIGMPYTKFGNRILYPVNEIDSWFKNYMINK